MKSVTAFKHMTPTDRNEVVKLNTAMVAKAANLRQQSNMDADSLHGLDLEAMPDEELAGKGAQKLWQATIETIRKQVMPVVAFREGLESPKRARKSESGESAASPTAADPLLDERTTSYMIAMGGESGGAAGSSPSLQKPATSDRQETVV
jgi:hypothetical protein